MLVTLALLTIIASLPVIGKADSQKHLVPSILKYTPLPAEPGNILDVWLQISNQREDAADVEITLNPDYPFSLPEDEEATRTVPFVPSLKDVVLKYRVLVDLGARNQDYNLTWTYHFDEQGGLFHYDAPVTVQATDASLTVDHYSISPEQIRPGSNATLTLTLRNNGRIGLKDVDVKLDLPSSSSFSTLGTGNVVRLHSIEPSEIIDVSYNLITDPSAETKVHVLPIILSYRDERNNRYNATTSISSIVNFPPSLLVTVDQSTLAGINKTGEVTFKLINKGATKVKFLTVELDKQKDFDLLSPSRRLYVGNLDADDFETVTYKVKALGSKPIFTINMTYLDPFNTEYTRSQTIPVTLTQPEKDGQPWYVWAAIAIAVITIMSFMYRHQKA